MILTIKVHPNSGKQEIIQISENEYYVNLKKPAEDNKANIELLNLLKKYFNVAAGNIKIIKGMKSRKKIIEINNC